MWIALENAFMTLVFLSPRFRGEWTCLCCCFSGEYSCKIPKTPFSLSKRALKICLQCLLGHKNGPGCYYCTKTIAIALEWMTDIRTFKTLWDIIKLNILFFKCDASLCDFILLLTVASKAEISAEISWIHISKHAETFSWQKGSLDTFRIKPSLFL